MTATTLRIKIETFNLQFLAAAGLQAHPVFLSGEGRVPVKKAAITPPPPPPPLSQKSFFALPPLPPLSCEVTFCLISVMSMSYQNVPYYLSSVEIDQTK